MSDHKRGVDKRLLPGAITNARPGHGGPLVTPSHDEFDREMLVPLQLAATRLCSTEYLDQRAQEQIGDALWKCAERINALWGGKA